MKGVVLAALLPLAAFASHINWPRYNSSTVYVGPYTWPPYEPVNYYNPSGGSWVLRYDIPVVTCDASTDTCTATGHNLPADTEVVFGTTGALPAPLKSWKQDNWKRYYLGNVTANSFKLYTLPGQNATNLVDLTSAGTGTHSMSFAGYQFVTNINVAWATSGFTCDSATNTCTLAGIGTMTRPGKDAGGFTTGFSVNVHSTGTLPGGLQEFNAGTLQNYALTILDADHFRFQGVTITNAGSGTHYLCNWGGDHGFLITAFSGFPPGTVKAYGAGGFGGSPLSYYSGYPNTSSMIAGIFKVPASSAPGDYTITFTSAEGGLINPVTDTFTLHVVLLTPASHVGPSSYPAIPGLSCPAGGICWEAIQTSSTNGGGASSVNWERCPGDRNNPTMNTGFSTQYSGVWFYDGAANFYEVADYTGDPSWYNCGKRVANQERDRLLTTPLPMGLDYVMMHGLYRSMAWGDLRFRRVIDQVVARADTGIWCSGQDTGVREASFALSRRLLRSKTLGNHDYMIEPMATALLGMLYEWSIGGPDGTLANVTYQEPFMAGLAGRELIEYYKQSHDERVPVVIQGYLDALWANGWYSETQHALVYNPYPAGDRCNTGCQTFTGPILNNLVAPMFAWYWRLTGDDTYRVRGDEMFSHNFYGGTPYWAKEWSQTYYWSWDFVRWRKGLQPAY